MVRYISQGDFIPFNGMAPPFAWGDHSCMLKIRQIRKEARVTQEALAAAIGTSQSNISEIEQGKHNPTLETLSKIATALNVAIPELFDEDTGRDEAELRFLAAYNSLPTDARLKIIELAEMMAATAKG